MGILANVLQKQLDVVREIELAPVGHTWVVANPGGEPQALTGIDVRHHSSGRRCLHWQLWHAALEALNGEDDVEMLVYGSHLSDPWAVEEPLCGSATRLQEHQVVDVGPLSHLVFRHTQDASHLELVLLPFRSAHQDSLKWLGLIKECAGAVPTLWVVSANSLVKFGPLRRVVEEVVHEVAGKVTEEDAAKSQQPPRGPALHDGIPGSQLVRDLEAGVGSRVSAMLPCAHLCAHLGPDDDVGRVFRGIGDGDVLSK